MNTEEVNVVLSYGALKSLRSKLKNEIRSLNKKIFHLKIENNLQFKIIQQLKTPNACSLMSPHKCQAGHYYCKIDHSRFNYVDDVVGFLARNLCKYWV